MSYIQLMRIPEIVLLQIENEWVEAKKKKETIWGYNDIEVATELEGTGLYVRVRALHTPIKRIRMRWHHKIEEKLWFLGDHWERGYGDLEWRGMVPERIMPWYFLTWDGSRTHGYGVKTGARSMCFWQADPAGVSLWLDVRNGGMGVELGGRELLAAVVVSRKGQDGESSFQAARAFCQMMCDKPRLPSFPVYGGNNWYYAYGNSSQEEILDDSKLIASLASNENNKPFMVIDDGWQLCHSKSCNGGPWKYGNYRFPDMEKLAGEMKEVGVRPGIWIRPLLTTEMIPQEWVLTNKRFRDGSYDQFMDPSVDGVLEHIAQDIQRIVDWGYQLIKHDFSTYDIFGRWGFEMRGSLTEDGWSFRDRSRTTAEIILELYRTIRQAAGDVLIIGCNTIGHLGAGFFEIQRTGDDTSGRDWERTRKMGINTLAFRMPQHRTFFASDADCVGLTNQVPWEFNKQWLYLLANSGTPLFVSADPKAVGNEEEKALKLAFEIASKPLPVGEPLDWMQNTCPQEWILNGQKVVFDWYGRNGINYMEREANYF